MKQKVNKSKEQKTVLELSSVDLQSQLIPLRGEMVMLDSVVANVYGVETKRINEAVKNNPEKFPNGYVIEPDFQEITNLRSKFVTSNGRGGNRYLPTVFTEQGVAMFLVY